MGSAIGIMDAVGFLLTARFFLANATNKKRVNALIFEIGRLLLLIAVIFFLCSFKQYFSSLFLLFGAIIFSLAGKFFFIAQRFKA